MYWEPSRPKTTQIIANSLLLPRIKECELMALLYQRKKRGLIFQVQIEVSNTKRSEPHMDSLNTINSKDKPLLNQNTVTVLTCPFFKTSNTIPGNPYSVVVESPFASARFAPLSSHPPRNSQLLPGLSPQPRLRTMPRCLCCESLRGNADAHAAFIRSSICGKGVSESVGELLPSSIESRYAISQRQRRWRLNSYEPGILPCRTNFVATKRSGECDTIPFWPSASFVLLPGGACEGGTRVDIKMSKPR